MMSMVDENSVIAGRGEQALDANSDGFARVAKSVAVPDLI
tara:strand:+ start:52468 stop:52587 length:120 start_codon:yes stop_codon:yes gene_type:complete